MNIELNFFTDKWIFNRYQKRKICEQLNPIELFVMLRLRNAQVKSCGNIKEKNDLLSV